MVVKYYGNGRSIWESTGTIDVLTNYQIDAKRSLGKAWMSVKYSWKVFAGWRAMESPLPTYSATSPNARWRG